MWLESEIQQPVLALKNGERITGSHERRCEEVNSKVANESHQRKGMIGTIMPVIF